MTLGRREVILGVPVLLTAVSSAGCQSEGDRSFSVKSKLEKNTPSLVTVSLAAKEGQIALVDPNTVVRIRNAVEDELTIDDVVLDCLEQRLFVNGTADSVATSLSQFVDLVSLTTPTGSRVYINPRHILQVYQGDPRVTHKKTHSIIRLAKGQQQVRESVGTIRQLLSTTLGVPL